MGHRLRESRFLAPSSRRCEFPQPKAQLCTVHLIFAGESLNGKRWDGYEMQRANYVRAGGDR